MNSYSLRIEPYTLLKKARQSEVVMLLSHKVATKPDETRAEISGASTARKNDFTSHQVSPGKNYSSVSALRCPAYYHHVFMVTHTDQYGYIIIFIARLIALGN